MITCYGFVVLQGVNMSEKLEKEILDFVEWTGSDMMPDPEHEPIRFAFAVKMYNYYKEQEALKDVE